MAYALVTLQQNYNLFIYVYICHVERGMVI